MDQLQIFWKFSSFGGERDWPLVTKLGQVDWKQKYGAFPMMKCKKELKKYSDCRNIAALYEMWVAESNGIVRIVAGSLEMAVSAHA